MNEEDDQERLLVVLERDFHSLDLSELKAEREKINTKNFHIQNELSDLAFHNYRTYVDVGKTAEYCKDKFSAMDDNMHQLRMEFPNLLDSINQFKHSSRQIFKEHKSLNEVESNNCMIWEILKFPKLMEKCIKTGRYEQVYAMTNFALTLKQTKLYHNKMFKDVVDYLLDARHSLLDELFSKFAGPLDLASSIQVVNNIRKIPYISNTQLRVTILQYRDMYLEKKVHCIMTEPDFILRVIEIYRECMYDTIVLYMAVFPETEIQRKFLTVNDDPRWERWTGSSQNFLLQYWAQHTVEKLLTIIRGAENKSFIDIETMISKLMSFAFSFGRMGLDYRPLVHNEFSHIIIDIFRRKMDIATKSLIAIKKLELIDDDIFENTRHQLEDETTQEDLSVLSAPLEMCIWDDLCVYGNSIIDALNETRHSISINFIIQVYRTIFSSFYSIFGWLDSLLSKSEEIIAVKRATLLLLRYFVPYINRCFFHCFPYEQCARNYFRAGYCSVEEYKKAFSFMKSDLFALCRQNLLSNLFEEVENDVGKFQHLTANTRGEEKTNEENEHLKNTTDDKNVLVITNESEAAVNELPQENKSFEEMK